MRDDTIAMPLLDERPRPDPTEPQFDWRFASQTSEPIPAAERDQRNPAAARSSLPIGSLLYLALVGLVAVATIGVFYGAGFRLLAPPKQMAAASGPHPLVSHGDILQVRREVSPAAPQSAVPGSGGVLSAAAASEAPQAATAGPRQPEALATVVDQPPSQTAAPPAAQASSTASSASPTSLTSLPQTSKRDAALSGGGKRRLSHSGRAHHMRAAARHPYRQSIHGGGALTPPAGQIRSFDELVTQLTGQPRYGVPSLTPPRPQQPDPFATPRVSQ